VFLGWYDPDKKTPARYKLEDALERYSRKFGRPAQTCITSPEDAAELEADKQAPAMPVRGAGFIPRYTFYVGNDEEPEEVVMPAVRNRPSAEERKPATRKGAASNPVQTERKPAAKKPAAKRPTVAKPPTTKVQPKAEPAVKPAATRTKTPGTKRTARTRQ
jgi:DnaK suppressor protein